MSNKLHASMLVLKHTALGDQVVIMYRPTALPKLLLIVSAWTA
jgi:hypothetical protein